MWHRISSYETNGYVFLARCTYEWFETTVTSFTSKEDKKTYRIEQKLRWTMKKLTDLHKLNAKCNSLVFKSRGDLKENFIKFLLKS